MAISDITLQQLAGTFKDILKGFDGDRANQLEFFNKFLHIKHTQLQQQKEFLTKKYGNEDQKVKDAENTLVLNTEVFKTVEAELKMAKFNPPDFGGTGWRVQGFVYDDKGEIVAGKTVKIVINEVEPVNDARHAVSLPNGYYSITLTSQQVDALQEKTLGLILITREEHPYIVAQNLKAVEGKIDYHDLILPENL